ncbi:MAG: carboxymuconolactone decarboxylase family protein [Acidimicrobiia bacterium]
MADEQRMDIHEVEPGARRAVLHLNAYAGEGGLGAGLLALVDIRASQINHCAWCLDMHTEEARQAGIEQRQIDLVAAWHGLAVLALLAVVSLFFTGRIPTTPIGDSTEDDDAADAAETA